MKYSAIIAIVIVTAVGLWWVNGDDSRQTSSTANTQAIPQLPAVETMEASALSETAEDENSTSDNANSGAVVSNEAPGQAVTTEETADAPATSPFTLLDGQENEAATASVVGDMPIAKETDNDDVAPVANDGTQLLQEPLQVPDSYPATDAAKYFIPKEERKPGRLGGPPPLDFPGGPSDPNRQGGESVFRPPAAPGQ